MRQEGLQARPRHRGCCMAATVMAVLPNMRTGDCRIRPNYAWTANFTYITPAPRLALQQSSISIHAWSGLVMGSSMATITGR